MKRYPKLGNGSSSELPDFGEKPHKLGLHKPFIHAGPEASRTLSRRVPSASSATSPVRDSLSALLDLDNMDCMQNQVNYPACLLMDCLIPDRRLACDPVLHPEYERDPPARSAVNSERALCRAGRIKFDAGIEPPTISARECAIGNDRHHTA